MNNRIEKIKKFNADMYEYRVKPEPLSMWVNVYKSDKYAFFGAYRNKQEALKKCRDEGRTVKMQEVPE